MKILQKKLSVYASAILIIILISADSSFSQSEMFAAHVIWKADEQPVPLKIAYETGIAKPEELTLKVFFKKDSIAKYSNEDLRFEFRWFHYYVTEKELMDAFTVNYDERQELDDSFYLSSSRKNLTPGWWEVHIIAKYDKKPVFFGKIQKFQIFIQ